MPAASRSWIYKGTHDHDRAIEDYWQEPSPSLETQFIEHSTKSWHRTPRDYNVNICHEPSLIRHFVIRYSRFLELD